MDVCLEQTVELLAGRFAECNIIAVRAKRMQNDEAIFDNFLLGGRCLLYLDAIVASACAHCGVPAAAALPLEVHGFSKGCTVVSRILMEAIDCLAEPHAPACPDGQVKPIVLQMAERTRQQNALALAVVDRIVAIHLIEPATMPASQLECIRDVASHRHAPHAPLLVALHTSPAMLSDPARPWLHASCNTLVCGLLGAEAPDAALGHCTAVSDSLLVQWAHYAPDGSLVPVEAPPHAAPDESPAEAPEWQPSAGRADDAVAVPAAPPQAPCAASPVASTVDLAGHFGMLRLYRSLAR